tara:strand:+ start:700 stop:1404 length:705 start_codon:yes stop_codon:yes gene_type:complete
MTTVNGTVASASASLKITYDELRREIGRFLGYSRTPGDWDSTETSDVSDVIRGGLRSFYFPSDISHRWTFLCPTVTLSISAGTRAYNLPADFIQMASPVTFSLNDKKGILSQVEPEELRAAESSASLSDTPRYFAIQARAQASDAYEILMYPTPDAALTIKYSYEQLPADLSSSNQYHLGSAAHSELLLASCLMIADKMINKESLDPSGGLYMARYVALLKSSIDLDNKLVAAA